MFNLTHIFQAKIILTIIFIILYINGIFEYSIINISYIKATILLNLYKHFLSLLGDLKAGIRKNPGIKFNPKGYSIDKAKLIKVSFIKIIWVFLYTAQKLDMKYQNNDIKIKLKI